MLMVVHDGLWILLQVFSGTRTLAIILFIKSDPEIDFDRNSLCTKLFPSVNLFKLFSFGRPAQKANVLSVLDCFQVLNLVGKPKHFN